VEVALDAAALGIGRLDDARARVTEVRHLGRQRRVGVGAEQHPGVADVEAAEGAERRDPEDQHGRADRHQRQRLPELVYVKDAEVHPVGNGPVPEGQREALEADAEHDAGHDERHQPERELEQQEREVLPGGRVAEPSPQPHPPPAGRQRPVWVRDLGAG
jgi:hypothetical protein